MSQCLAVLVQEIRYSCAEILSKVAESVGYPSLKPEQQQAILDFVSGRDVFVSLPTGYGKSLCFVLLPKIFDCIRKVDNKSLVLIVSPLICLMEDQAAKCSSLGISSAIWDRDSETRKSIRNGEIQLMFTSPEVLFSNPTG